MAAAFIAVAHWVGSIVFDYAVEAGGASLVTASALATVATAATVVAEVAAVAALSTALLSPHVGGDLGTQVDFKADPRGPIPYAIGRTGTGGNEVFQQTAGKNGLYNNYVTISSLGPIDSYESFLVNGVAVTFGTDSGEGASGFYQNRMWLKTQLGALPESGYLHWTATGTKDTPADHSGMPAEWTSAHKLSGFAADLWALQYNSTAYSAGVPKRLWVLKGVKVYDPRKDSTYPGGSGSHRALNESTYEWSDNPYLHALTWCLGRFHNGVRMMGVGAPVAMIDMAAFVEGANIAEANSWVCGGVVYSTDDKWEVLKAFLQAGGGQAMRLGARISCIVNTPRVSLATLTGADVVGDVQIAGTQSRRTRINTIWPQYREEAQGWQVVTVDAPIQVSAYVTADGQIRSRQVQYSLVQHSTQAGQLARYDIENGREFTPVVLPCKPRWRGYKPGDVITVNEPEYGLVSQPLLILKRSQDPQTMTVTLTCRSESAGKHAYALGQTLSPPATPGLTANDPTQIAPPGSGAFTLTGVSILPNRPTLLLDGSSDNPNAKDLLIRYRVVGDPDWIYWPAVDASQDPIVVEITGVDGGSTYEVQTAYRSARGAVSATWTAEGSVVAGEYDVAAAFSDGALTPGEKLYVVPTIKALIAARTSIRAVADIMNLVYGYAAVRTAYEDAATALDSALAALTSPVHWDDSSDKTTIASPSAFITVYENATKTQTILQATIDFINAVKTSDSKNLFRQQDWAAAGGASTVTSTFGQSGQQFRLPGATTGANIQTAHGGYGTIAQGGIYTLSWWAKASSGTQTFRATFRDGSNGLMSDLTDQVYTATTTWQQFSWVGIQSADSDFPTALLKLYEGAGDIASGQSVDVTDIKITFGNQVTSYSPSPDDPALLRIATYVGELNADKTSTHTAAGFTGQGPLATSTLTEADVSNVLMRLPSKNLWRKQDWTIVGATTDVSPITPSGNAGVSKWGWDLAHSASIQGLKVTGKTFGIAATDFYSFSFWAKVKTGAGPCTLRGGYRDSSDAATITDIPDVAFTVTTTWQRFTWEGSHSALTALITGHFWLFANTGDIASGMVVEVSDLMMQYGSQSTTAWVPSPDDVYLLQYAGYVGSLTATHNVYWGDLSSAPGGAVDGDSYRNTSVAPYITYVRVSGSWVDNASLGGAFGSTLYRTSGGIVATLSDFLTSSGTAAGYSGQGPWGTETSQTPTNLQQRLQYTGTDGKIYDYRGFVFGYSIQGVAGRTSQPLTSTDTTITVASVTVDFPLAINPGTPGSVGANGYTSITAPSTSFSGLTPDTTYSVFWISPTTWSCQPPSNTPPYYSSADGWLFIGAIRTAVSGTSNYNPPPYGSGGVAEVGYCIWEDAILSDCGKRAGDAQPGDALVKMTQAGDDIYGGLIERMERSEADGVRLRTASGGVLTVSMTAPIMTRSENGGMPHAIRAHQAEVGTPVPLLAGNGVLWDVISSIEPVGRIQVIKFSTAEGIFAASDDAAAPAIFTHNGYSKP